MMTTLLPQTELPFKVLFVDDELHARKYFQKAFSKRFAINIASNVSDAKQKLADNKKNIGVIVTDYNMPEEKGIELLEHAKSQYPNIIRIMTTAYSDVDKAVEAINKGEVFRYIHKPWDINAVNSILDQAMHLHLQQRLSVILSKHSEHLYIDFKDACEKWLLHAFHTCDDIDGIHSGLDAICCIFTGHLEQSFQDQNFKEMRRNMDAHIDGILEKLAKGMEAKEKPYTLFDLTKH